MAQEIEIKLRINDEKAFRHLLKRLDARPVAGGTGRVHEETSSLILLRADWQSTANS